MYNFLVMFLSRIRRYVVLAVEGAPKSELFVTFVSVLAIVDRMFKVISHVYFVVGVRHVVNI